MNDDFYKDDPVINLRPSHIRKQRKPPFVREFGFFSPKRLNREPVPSGREGYYLYYYIPSKGIMGLSYEAKWVFSIGCSATPTTRKHGLTI